MAGTGILSALAAALQSPLAVQPVEQLPSAEAAGPVEAIEQLGTATREVAGSARPAQRDASDPAQLTGGGDARTPTPQVSRAERAAPPPAQLNRGGPTAQAPEALSSPAQGRRGDQAAVGGRDRCDRETSDPALRAACARAIETRSAEFARPDPAVLSPEQRILVEQRLREDRNVQRSPVRRMAQGAATNPDDLNSQEVASLLLGRPSAGDDAQDREQPGGADAQAEAAAAIVQAIINGAQSGPR